ncbi:hypothetical protein MHB50_05025 [Siminovitchia sp. FSL H7-0308]|uniref:hypothetical protein n=1 Tax=Siminovitchia sp. FSL H7-0308 TaxID=2921432 RepID=UPI0030EE0E61
MTLFSLILQQYFYRSYQCPAINANTLVKVNKVLINRETATNHQKENGKRNGQVRLLKMKRRC